MKRTLCSKANVRKKFLELPEETRLLLNDLNDFVRKSNNVDVFEPQYAIIGGAVRDWMVGLPPKDLDIVIDCESDVLFNWLLRVKYYFPEVKDLTEGYSAVDQSSSLISDSSGTKGHLECSGIMLDLWTIEDSIPSVRDVARITSIYNAGSIPLLSINSGCYIPHGDVLIADKAAYHIDNMILTPQRSRLNTIEAVDRINHAKNFFKKLEELRNLNESN